MGSRIDEIRPKKVVTFSGAEARMAAETMGDIPVHKAIARSRSMSESASIEAVTEYWKRHYVQK